jgi:hypothetical protein
MRRVSVHAFVDESFRDGRYLLAVALVSPAELRRVRGEMRHLRKPHQREVHFQREKPQRRREILDQVVAVGVQVSIYTAACRGRDQERARAACLHRLVLDLVAVGAQRLILDSRPGRDTMDNRTIRDALAKSTAIQDRLSWDHLDSVSDPLIWISDVVGWAYGAGGDWLRRVAPILVDVVDCT